MAKDKTGPKDPNPAIATAGTQLTDVSVPVEGAAQAATAEGEKKPAKPAIPEHLKKGNRVCAACGTTEAEFLAKNPRYSLCQGVDVLCYRKGHRVDYKSTLDEVNARFPDKVGKSDNEGKPLIEQVGGTGIKPGILIRGAIKYSRKAETAATPSAPAAAGSASATSAG